MAPYKYIPKRYVGKSAHTRLACGLTSQNSRAIEGSPVTVITRSCSEGAGAAGSPFTVSGALYDYRRSAWPHQPHDAPAEIEEEFEGD